MTVDVHRHDGIGQLEKRGLIEHLRNSPRQGFIAVQRPQLARFAQHIGCDDELSALVFATPHVIGRVLFRASIHRTR